MAILEVKNLKAYYITHKYGRSSTVRAVDGVSFEVNKNEIYGIAGESGCGKSTLLKAVSGLVAAPADSRRRGQLQLLRRKLEHPVPQR